MERYQVFISSTYTDLKEERQAVLESILKLRHIPVGMEQFVATSDEQFGYIKKLIDETDYYILIIGNRYGTLTNEGISFTEKEFDYAVSKNVPILAFVHNSPDSLPVNRSDTSASARKQLSRFREKVMDHRLVSSFSWDSPASLAREVVTALSNAIRDYPRPGWERVSEQSINKKKAIEIYDPYRSVQLKVMDMEYPFEHERIMTAFTSVDGTEADTSLKDSIADLLSYGSREYRYPLLTMTGPFYGIEAVLKESLFLDEAKAVTLLAICGLSVSSEEVDRLVLSQRKQHQIKEDIIYDYQTMTEWNDSFSRIVVLSRMDKKRKTPNIHSSLPRFIPIYSLYGIKTASELDSSHRWESADVTSGLPVPIGIDDNRKPYYLDLDYKKSGPNALIAGMVGSGKTEFLATYLLSLAINYHPDEVGFLIFDFKNGELVSRFYKFPHFLGGLSDANSNNLQRMLIAIRAEQIKRERLLLQTNTQLIDEYLKLYKTKAVQYPMPHVFIFIDEFWILKQQAPEFYDEIKSLCRTGRAFGFHIVLGTQRAAGVVDYELRGSVNTRICMKVVSEADSMEMIKRSSASFLDTPGRGYVQSGYDDAPKLVQFTYGRARTLFGNDQAKEISDYICNMYVKPQVPPICLPPLPFEIPFNRQFINVENSNSIPLGILDDPENQLQSTYYFDYTGSNLLAVGTNNVGKTNLLSCVIRGSAERYKPIALNVYVIEAGKATLSAFEQLPVIGGVISPLDVHRLDYLVSYLLEQINIRKEAFTAAGVSDYLSYKEANPGRFPFILLLIDNVVELQASYFRDDDWLSLLCNYGLTFGVGIVATAPTCTHIQPRLISTFATRIAFYCSRKEDYEILLEDRSILPTNTPGRCILKTAQSLYEFQTFLAFEEKNPDEVLEYVNRYHNAHEQDVAFKIPTLPTILNKSSVLSDYAKEMNEAGKVVVGINYNTMLPCVLSLETRKLLLVSGSANSTEPTEFLDYLIEATEKVYTEKVKWYIVDSQSQKLSYLRSQPNVLMYGTSKEEMYAIINDIDMELKKRDTLQTMVDTVDGTPFAFPLLVFVVNDPAKIELLDRTPVQNYLETADPSLQHDLCVVLSGDLNKHIRYNAPEVLKLAKEMKNGIMFHQLSDIQAIDTPVALFKKFKVEQRKQNDFFLFQNGNCDYVMGVKP